ncbi:MAG: BREX system ATP-binding domain-containing protein [Defluviicoccus sp.]
MTEPRHAIEALRAGVPNRAAIRLLGTREDGIRQRFLETLKQCQHSLQCNTQPTGQVIAGGFGSGKSHLLGYLKELALAENFIVSWVVISKETPLFDPGRLYLSAMRFATVPGCNDDVMTAVLARLKPGSQAFEELEGWASDAATDLSPVFAALLYLFARPATTPDVIQYMARFLAGGPLNLTRVKQGLRDAGAAKLFPLKAVKQADIVQQRLRFVPRLFTAAGFDGWVVLMDEVELIGRYGILQRGRSYAELARWLGIADTETVPGAVAVAAVTDDFFEEVITKRRDDEQVPLKLVNKNERAAAERARRGIEFLERERKRATLRPPDQQQLQTCLDKVRGLYDQAYGWQPEDIEIGPIAATTSMRQHIKSWITTWDLERLYRGQRPEIETIALPTNYEEMKEIEPAREPAGIDFDDE